MMKLIVSLIVCHKGMGPVITGTNGNWGGRTYYLRLPWRECAQFLSNLPGPCGEGKGCRVRGSGFQRRL